MTFRCATVMFALLLAVTGGAEAQGPGSGATLGPNDLSPSALALAPDGRTLYVACATAGRVLVYDLQASQVVRVIDVPRSPLGLVLNRDGDRLYVTCAAPRSTVCVIDTASGGIVGRIPAGHTCMAPVLTPDARTLVVCNRFENEVSFIDVASGVENGRVEVQREPVAAALTPNGGLLLVANHLHAGRADDGSPAAAVSVIDVATRAVLKHIVLPRGSGLLRGIAVSPDGRWAAVTHVLARYYFPTTQIEFGRINSNALTLLDLERRRVANLMFLDTAGRGAANPWAIAWSGDGERLFVTLAGTHEISVIDAAAFTRGEVLRPVRIALPGRGPRAIAVSGGRLFVAQYFSDNLCEVEWADSNPEPTLLELGPAHQASLVRRGEMLFNDATLCFQGWQSCASCHDSDARTDALNWDLLNDGMGNPKNARSLVWAHRTPPAMATGVRANAEVAVRAGIRYILFSPPAEEVALAMDAYLGSLEPLASPHLRNGARTASAERGRAIFEDRTVGCSHCHAPALYTNRRAYDVGTAGSHDPPEQRFDTPTLVELWRTAPYLHDGSAATLRDVLTTLNPQNRHGRTSHLTGPQLDELEDFLLSL